jgi:molybdopterin/thiamine biosynthesis adenylyltransferase
LPEFLGQKVDPGEVFASARIALVGTGAVGRAVALHLARLFPRELWLVDRGRFKPESLITQPILPQEVGRPKASQTGRLCKMISPDTRIQAADGPIEQLDLFAFHEAQLVVLATDNLAAEIETGQRCLYLGQPLVQASVHGGTLTSQVRFFGNRDAAGPCPACGYGEQEWGHLDRQTRFSCEGWQNRKLQVTTSGPVTASLSFLCSLAADLALVQVTRYLLGLGGANSDTLLEYCGYTHRTVNAPLPVDPQCRCEHVRWDQVCPPRPLGDCSLVELAGVAGLPSVPGAESVAATLDGLQWVRRAVCACGRAEPVGRWLALDEPAGCCRSCGRALPADPFFSHQRTPLAVLGSRAAVPLRMLTTRAPRWVLLHRGNRGAFLRDMDSVSEEVSE